MFLIWNCFTSDSKTPCRNTNLNRMCRTFLFATALKNKDYLFVLVLSPNLIIIINVCSKPLPLTDFQKYFHTVCFLSTKTLNFMLHVLCLTEEHVSMPNTRCHRGLNLWASSWRTASSVAASSCFSNGSFDSSTNMRAFPHLLARHDIERVPVHGEGHVPEDGTAILHHSHCLVQHSSLQRAVHPDLQRHKQTQRWRDSDWMVTVHL